MDRSTDDSAAKTGRTLEIEMRLVRDAIAMVASGGSPRVILAGLRFGEALLASGRLLASEAGVRLVPLWMPDDAGADIAVERITDG
jgi:hypothetical protein